MTTIHDAYINALLADASYVNDFLPGMTGAKLTAQVTGRMTPDLAKYIGDNFTKTGVSSNIPTFSNYASAARTARLTVM
jgi:hypothetical protein